MSTDEEAEGSARTESEEDRPEPSPSEMEKELNSLSKSKTAAPIERDFTEINRWSRDDHSKDEIYGFIRARMASGNGRPTKIPS